MDTRENIVSVFRACKITFIEITGYSAFNPDTPVPTIEKPNRPWSLLYAKCNTEQ